MTTDSQALLKKILPLCPLPIITEEPTASAKLFYHWSFASRETTSEASTFLVMYGIHDKTHGCIQVRDRRQASHPLTGIGAGPCTDFDLHPQCNFQSYTHGSRNAPPPDQGALSANQLNQHFADVGARVVTEALQAARDAAAADAGPRPYRACVDAPLYNAA